MSIQSEITRISGAKTNIAISIENKGVVVPSGALISDMPSLIDQITGGIDTSDATATPGDILKNKTAYVNGEKITGNIVSKSSSDLTSSNNTVTVPAGYYSSQATKTVGTAKAAATYNTSASDQSIAAGQYLTGAQTIKAVTTSNISAGNIKTGVVVKVGDANSATRIKNVTGTFTAANTVSSGQTAAEANKILTGYSAWVGGSEVKGNISSKAAATYNTSSSDQSIASGQYLSGAQTIKAVTTSNISAGNIKIGVNVKVGDANSAGRIKNITGTFDGFITSRAVIHVIAPSGSTVVFKKGSTTMKTVSSSDALPNNNDSAMRDYYCSVASGDYTSWTMTATSGSKSSSKTITISAAKQYDVLLIFETYIVKGGYVQSPFTLKLNYGPTQIYTHTENYNAQGYLYTLKVAQYGECGFCTEQTVNVNNYSSLKIDVAFDFDRANDAGYVAGIGLASSKNSITTSDWTYGYTSVQAAYYLFPSRPGTNRRTCTIDISSLKGNFYITAYEGTYGYQGTRIYNFWLA